MISSISAQCQETDPAKSSRRPHGDIKLRWPLSPRDERLPSVPFGPLRSARCGPAVLRPRLSAHAASTQGPSHGPAGPPHEQGRQECAPAAGVEGEGQGARKWPSPPSRGSGTRFEPPTRIIFRKRGWGRLSAWLRLLPLPPGLSHPLLQRPSATTMATQYPLRADSSLHSTRHSLAMAL